MGSWFGPLIFAVIYSRTGRAGWIGLGDGNAEAAGRSGSKIGLIKVVPSGPAMVTPTSVMVRTSYAPTWLPACAITGRSPDGPANIATRRDPSRTIPERRGNPFMPTSDGRRAELKSGRSRISCNQASRRPGDFEVSPGVLWPLMVAAAGAGDGAVGVQPRISDAMTRPSAAKTASNGNDPVRPKPVTCRPRYGHWLRPI
jgi:hypothetical protein